MCVDGPPLVTSAFALRGFGALTLASALFGASAVFVRVATEEMVAPQVAWVRYAGVLLLMLALTRGQGLAPKPENRRWLVLRGILGGIANICFYAGIERAGPGLAMVLHSTYPVFTAVWAVLLMGEQMNARIVAALVLNLGGVGLALGEGIVGGPAVVSGVFLSLTGGVLAGTSVATVSQLRKSESATLIATWFMGVAVVMASPAVLLGFPSFSWRLAWSLGGVILTSAGGQWLLHHGLGFTTATSGSLAAATSVITAAVLGAVVLGEPIGPNLGGAAVLMIVAVWLAAPRRVS